MRICIYGEDILREKGEHITNFDDELKALVADMQETMYEEDGAGIAAQQVGIAKQLCVIDLRYCWDRGDFTYKLDGKFVPPDVLFPLVYVNPKITKRGEEFEKRNEACLSLPDMYGPVTRPTEIVVEYQDVDGNPHTLECNGLLARCSQHEIDHLHGELYLDRMELRDLDRLKSKLKKLKRETRDFLKKQKKSKS